MGVARGLGDHDLVVKSSLVNCKEFLSCQPEVRVKKIDELDRHSVLIMASDGLWDVLPNDKVYEIIKKADDMHDGERAENFCQRLAKNLVLGNFPVFSQKLCVLENHYSFFVGRRESDYGLTSLFFQRLEERKALMVTGRRKMVTWPPEMISLVSSCQLQM